MHTSSIFAWRGWLSAAIMIPAIAVASLSRPLLAEGDLGDVEVDFIGWLVLGAGVFLRLWATLYIGGHKSMSLVTEGPYALCRHPLYVGSFLILIALAAFLISPLVLCAALVVGAVHAFIVVPSEERHAVACFGDAYHAYCAQTPRFFPRRPKIGRPGTVEVKVAEFLRELARAYGFILLGAAAELLAYARGLPWWPRLFYLP